MNGEPRIREKVWDPSIEEKLLDIWSRERLYEFRLDDGREPFIIDTPPPYPSGRPWHIGAAAHYAQIDMIARTARMLNHNVYFPIGIDRNGLPVEIYTERTRKVSMRSIGRERFIEMCREALDELEREMVAIMRRLGLSADLANYYRTDSEEYRALTQATFIELWHKGLVYEATRPNNYCPDCGTTIADAEVVYKDLQSRLVYIRFRVDDGYGSDAGEMVIATTRPELLCSCRAVIVNPDDARYRHLHGKTAVVPLYDTRVRIVPHPYASMEFGSGAVMVCSYGDHTDVQLFRELGLQEVIALDTNGLMTTSAGKYAGMRVRDARDAIIEDLNSAGLVVKVESIMHRTPVCERSNTPIEIIPMNEFYVKQMQFIDELKEIAGSMVFHPEMHRQILLNWLNSIAIDWPISRRRFYATEIPIWYCRRCGRANLPEKGRYYRPWKDKPPFSRCVHCGGTEFIGEERTFDTWMDSSISPLFISKYGKDERFFSHTYPATLRPQAKDIVRTWLHYTILRCYQLTGRAPFKHAWIMGYGLDEKGERMSKSRGNVIDPFPVIGRYGADTFRLWSASEVNLGYDFRCSEQRIAGMQKFLTKLWNIARFISSFPRAEIDNGSLQASDRWILAELSSLVERCMQGYKEFNFFIPSNAIREFVWNLFAPHYIEMVKARAYGQGFSRDEQESACYTLYECLSTVLLLLAPITPFITDHLWRELYSRSIHLERFPESRWSREMSRYTSAIVEFNSKIWSMKKGSGRSLKDPISVSIPDDLREFSKDLRAMHNIVG
ncbi:MAG: valine--tRNA ligase [Candidatus Nitrosocaldus sp.]|nr:valine--tRNA ligase [Candidatus Nitrosocaldus sp.]MDW7999510.1 valine--tRNA ligase [Candidatus Nitrosocaldus sp.]